MKGKKMNALSCTKSWAEDTMVKAIRTMAQTAVGLIGTNTVGMTDVDWISVGSASLVAGIVCVLMALTQIKTKNESEEE